MGQREVGVPWGITTAPPDTHGQGKEPKIGITQHPASTGLSTRQDPTCSTAWGHPGGPCRSRTAPTPQISPFFLELLPTLRKGGPAGERFPAGMAGTVPMTTQPPLPQPHLLPPAPKRGLHGQGGCSALPHHPWLRDPLPIHPLPVPLPSPGHQPWGQPCPKQRGQVTAGQPHSPAPNVRNTTPSSG